MPKSMLATKQVFFSFLFEKSSKTGFAHYMDGRLLRPSARKLKSVEIHLLRGRTSLLKPTENRTTSWKSNGEGWFPCRRRISWNKPVGIFALSFLLQVALTFMNKSSILCCAPGGPP